MSPCARRGQFLQSGTRRAPPLQKNLKTHGLEKKRPPRSGHASTRRGWGPDSVHAGHGPGVRGGPCGARRRCKKKAQSLNPGLSLPPSLLPPAPHLAAARQCPPPPHSLALSLLGLTPNNAQARLGQAGVPVGRGRAHQQPPKPKAKHAISRVCLILPCTKALIHPFSYRPPSQRRRTGARTNSSPFTTNFQRCASTKPSIQFLKLAPLGRQPPPLQMNSLKTHI